MNKILSFSVKDLLREINVGKELVNNVTPPSELNGYKNWISQILTLFDNHINNLCYYLNLQQASDDALLQAITTEFIIIKNNFSLLSNTYIPLLIRVNSKDLPVLKFIKWVHDEHPQTVDHPFIIANGDFSIYTSKIWPIRYHLPVTSQVSLLHLPLIFHEYGHLLFIKHKDEMVALVKEYQKKLDEIIVLPVQKFDSKNYQEVTKRSLIIETWYEWMEELFCDMVGLTIGGAAYLHSFSYFVRFGGSSAFSVPDKELARRSHPVSWLRFKILADKANQLGLLKESKKLSEEWATIANCLKVKEDHFGYYDDEIHKLIVGTLKDMLIEANPISFHDYINKNDSNYIKLVNHAWGLYLKDQDKYPEWEQNVFPT